MRMRIMPGSLWLAYTLTRPGKIESMLPAGLDMARAPLLGGESVQRPKLLFNAYEVDSPWMRGTRIDVLVMAQHQRTRAMHLVLLDCYSNTLRWNPIDGVQRANAFRTKGPGRAPFELYVRNYKDRFLVRADVSRQCPVDWRFAVEANRECYWRGVSSPFAMTFNESSIALPVRRLTRLECTNTLWSDVRLPLPSHAFIHPHGMDFDVKVDDYRAISTGKK